MTSDLLNWSQRNSIAVVLCSVEMTLRQALVELANQDGGILYRRTGVLSPEQQEQLRQLIDAALGEIAVLAKELNLPVEVQNARDDLWGKLAVDWADLHDIRSEKLIRYGKVAPALPATLDPPLLRLIEQINRLRSLLSDKPNTR